MWLASYMLNIHNPRNLGGKSTIIGTFVSKITGFSANTYGFALIPVGKYNGPKLITVPANTNQDLTENNI
jgi:hypothetical protein